MMNTALLLAQDNGNNVAGGIGAMIGMVVYLGLVILFIAGMWKTFEKAGKPGWAALVPIYNLIVMLEIAGKPIWWILLLFIPCVNIIAIILIFMAFAKAYGKSEIFGIGLALLGFIFFPILGFGDAKYIGAPRS